MPKSVRVSNGKETLEIQESDLKDAANDGYLPTEKVIIVRGKDKLEIDPQDLPDAMKDGYNFLATKKKVGSVGNGNVLNGGTQTPSPSQSVSPSVSSSVPVSEPTQPQAAPINTNLSRSEIRSIKDYVSGNAGGAAKVEAENAAVAQKAVPKIIARQASKAVTPISKLAPQQVDQQAKEAMADPLMSIWLNNAQDPIGQLEDAAKQQQDDILTSKKEGTWKNTIRDANRLQVANQMAAIAKNNIFTSAASAEDFLKKKGVDIDAEIGNYVAPTEKQPIGAAIISGLTKPIPEVINSLVNPQQVSTDQPKNKTEQLAIARVKQYRDANKFIDNNTFEDAAVQYAASQNPVIARQVEKLGSNYKYDIPNSMQGQMVYSFLNNPDVVERAQQDPTFKEKYQAAAANLNTHFPEFAKTRVANIIAQSREDKGYNNGFVNIVGADSTDKLVDELVSDGKLNESDKSVYEKMIRPDLGVLKSIGRGVGRMIPGAMAAIDEAPIATPGIAENFQNSLVNTLHGAANSVEDFGDKAFTTYGGAKPIDDKNKLYDILSKDGTAKAIDPQGLWHKITQNTGHLTGFMVPMILGSEVLGAAGATPKIGETINAGLMFEGENSEQALRMFPDNPKKQYAYTAAATGGDMFFTELLPTKKAATGLRATLKEDILHTVDEFTEGKITAAAAKESLLKKATTLIGNTAKENAKLGATLSGFNLFHNGLDAAFGGRDVSADEAAQGAVESFMSGFLGGTLISAASAGNNRKLTASTISEMASRPDYYKKVIEDGVKDNPALQATANERIANLNEAAIIHKEVEPLPLSEPQKEKYLLEALNQKVWERKAQETTDDVIRADYEKKAKEAKAKKEAIYKGEDLAPEHQSFAQPAETPVDNFGYKEKIAAATTETEKEQISKDYAEYIAEQQTGQSTDGGNRKALLKQAQSIVEAADIKGTTAATIKDWAKNDPKEFEQALQDISAQAADPNSREKTIETFGQDLVDIAEKLTKQTQSTPEAEGKQAPNENEIVNSQSQNIENGTGSENQTSSEDLRSQNVTNENTIPSTQKGSANEAANTTSQATAGTEAVREQEYTTKTGKYTVKYDEKGNRVVVDKDGNPLPEFVMRVTKKSKIDAEGKPIPESVKNGIIGNILREHDKAYNYNFGDKANVDEIPANVKDEEKDAWVVEHSNNPAEIASVYRNIPKESSALNSVEGAILEHGIGKVKNQSFKDVSDKNNITTSLAKSYLNEGKGRPLDIIAQEISNDSGVEVTPEDVANMMIRFPNGLREAEVLRDGETRQQAASKFEKLTGIPLNDRTAEQAAIQNVPKEVFGENETAFASEPMPEDEVINWLQEQEKNDYYDDNGIPTEANGQPREDLSTNNENAEGMEGTAKTPPGEVAPSTTGSSEQGDTEKVAEVGGNEPPTESGATTVDNPSEDWTPIHKAQLTEAETLLKKFPFGKAETWDNSVTKGIASLAKDAIDGESLYETSARKVAEWAEQIKREIDSEGKSTFNPSDEEIAQMAFHRAMTNKQIGDLESDLTSPIEAVRNAAELTMDNLQTQKEMVDYVLHNTATTAGRAFSIRQMVGRIDSENNLQVKRMDIIRKQGGKPLSEKQELALRDIADESSAIAKERSALEKKKADQDFEAAVKIEVERRLKERGATKTTSIKEGGKKVADVIRRLKMPKGGLRSDFTLGTWDIAIEGIAKIVEGGASIAEAVKKLIEDKVIAFKDENARNAFEEYVSNYEKHDIVDKIAELAKDEGSNTLTKSAVGEGAVNDLVRHYIDNGVRGKDILDRVHEDLQSVFPEISKQDIRDAYLKEGEYRFEKKDDINRETQAATQQLKTIAKLQTDLADLQNERDLRKRSGEKRELTAEEKSLQSEKEELLKKKRVEEVNKRIKEVNDRLDVLKNNRNKTTERVDADIEAARKRLQSEIGKLGLKLERGSKDEKALKEAVAEQHNKRADNIVEGIDKRLSDPKITPQERAALENAKKAIEKSKISPDSALDLSRAISKANENIELGRKELAAIASLSDLKKQTGLAQVEMGRDQINAEQQILLDRYKKTLQKKINENTRRIAAKEFVDKEPSYLKSTDAEAIKLEIKERQVNAKFNKLAKDAQWENMSRRQKVVNVVQNLYIASLVGHTATLAKVAASALTKQPLNTITSQTFGRLGGRIFNKIRPALRGEGAESLRKETQRYKAQYGAIGEKKMLRIVAEGKEKAQQANERFNNAKDRLEELEGTHGTDSKEYQSFLNGEYKKAETKQKEALLDNISNSMYEWIGGNSFKDAAELFLHAAPQLEQLIGKAPRESWSEYNKREKAMFVLSSVAALHGVLKNFSARAEFAASFVARLENKLRNGIDISTPDEILKTVNESYINFQRGKYQEDNPITSGFKAALNGIEKMGERNPEFKGAADVMTGLLKFENPIVRTPINIAKEAIVEYALGVPISIMKYRGALKEGKAEAKTVGIAANDMKGYLRDYMAKIDPDKADFIYRAFRKGGFGLGMMALAATGAVQFGGFYNRDDRRKKSEKLGVGEIQIGDHQLSKLQAKILTHTSAIFPLLLWTNYARVKEKQESKGKDAVDANWEATKEDIQGMIDQVPIGTEFQNPLRGVNIPVVGPIMQDIAEGIDTDKSGNKIDRKPTGNVLNQLWEGMELRIPKLRENVPEKKK